MNCSVENKRMNIFAYCLFYRRLSRLSVGGVQSGRTGEEDWDVLCLEVVEGRRQNLEAESGHFIDDLQMHFKTLCKFRASCSLEEIKV